MFKVMLGLAAVAVGVVVAPVASADEWQPNTDWVLDHERVVVKDVVHFMDARTDWVLDHERSVKVDNKSFGGDS